MADVKEQDLPKIASYSDIKEVRLVKTDGTSTGMAIDTFINQIAEKVARVDGFASVVAELMGSLIVYPNVPFGDLDEVLINTAFIVPSTKYIENLKNRPPIDDYFIFLSIVRVSSSDYGQIAIDYFSGHIYTRQRGENWVKIS